MLFYNTIAYCYISCSLSFSCISSITFKVNIKDSVITLSLYCSFSMFLNNCNVFYGYVYFIYNSIVISNSISFYSTLNIVSIL